MAIRRGKLEVGVSHGRLEALGHMGACGDNAGGAGILRGTVRVMVWGALAMAATAFVGWIFGRWSNMEMNCRLYTCTLGECLFCKSGRRQ